MGVMKWETACLASLMGPEGKHMGTETVNVWSGSLQKIDGLSCPSAFEWQERTYDPASFFEFHSAFRNTRNLGRHVLLRSWLLRFAWRGVEPTTRPSRRPSKPHWLLQRPQTLNIPLPFPLGSPAFCSPTFSVFLQISLLAVSVQFFAWIIKKCEHSEFRVGHQQKSSHW